MTENVGIVIIGRNEGVRLKKCILSVLSNAVPVIYVDSNSTDGSLELAQTLQVKTILLDAQKPINASVARNSGFNWLLLKYPDVKYVHFIDADCELHEDWLSKATSALDDNPSLAAVCGRLREKYLNLSVYTRIFDMSWYIKPGEIKYCGGIATVRRTVYENLKGFDEALIAGADPEFYTRAALSGHKSLCIDAEMATHDSAMSSVHQYWIRTIKTGFAYANGTDLGVWRDKQRSIIIWAAFIPLLIFTASIIESSFLGLVLIYPIQMLRTAKNLSIPYSFNDKLLYGVFCVFDKFPQFLGVLKYHYNRRKGQRVKIIEYK